MVSRDELLNREPDTIDARLVDRFARLTMVARVLASGPDVDEIVGIVREQAMAGVGASVVGVKLVGTADVPVPAGIDAIRPNPVALDGEDVVSRSLRQGEPVWLVHWRNVPPWLAELATTWPRSWGWAVIPLRSRGQVFGVIGLSLPWPAAFDTIDRQFIGALSDLAALALVRAINRLWPPPVLSSWSPPTLEQAMKNSTEALVIVDEGGDIIDASQQLAELLGYRRHELIGRSVEILLPMDLRKAHAAHRRLYVDDPTPRPLAAGLAIVARHAHGTSMPVEVSLSPCATPYGLCTVAAMRPVRAAREPAFHQRPQRSTTSEWPRTRASDHSPRLSERPFA